MGYEAEALAQQREYLGALELALHYEVAAGEASHGAPVDDAGTPLGVVAQVGGGEVLDGVEYGGGEGRLAVGLGEADVECGEGVARGCDVAPGEVYAAQEPSVVDGEAGNFVHSWAMMWLRVSKVWRGASSQKF